MTKKKTDGRVEIYLPAGEGAPEVLECAVNGYNYIIRRGETVRVPYEVYLLLHQSGAIG